MKTRSRVLLPFWAVLSFSSVANVADNSDELKEEAVYAKCHVELVGGSETLSFWLIKPSLLNTLPKKVVGKEILNTINAQEKGRNEKVTIYKVNQCVLEQDEFSSSRARTIDENFER